MESLAKLPWLTQLDVAYANLSDSDMQKIGELNSLQELRLDGNRITDEGLHYLSNVRSLRRISLTSTDISGDGLTALSGIPLTSLQLTGENVTVSAIRSSSQLKTLQGLRICGVKNVNTASLVELSNLQDLAYLDLSFCDFTNCDVSVLSTLSSMKRLELRSVKMDVQSLSELKAHSDFVILVDDDTAM